MPNAVDELFEWVQGRRQHWKDRPVVIGLDGRSGVGKSTLAEQMRVRLVSAEVSCTVIEGDEFYAGGTGEEWDRRSAEEKADLVIDWRRQAQVLVPLRSGQPASFHGYDWEAFDGSLAAEATTCAAAEVVVLEGAYSCRPELHEWIDLRVAVSCSESIRHARLGQREGDDYRDEWLARWTEAELHYFGTVMPDARFDLLLTS